jgi:hypothetical protein
VHSHKNILQRLTAISKAGSISASWNKFGYTHHGLRRVNIQNTLGSSTTKLLHKQGHKEQEVHVVYIFKQNLSARFNPGNSIIGKLLHVHRQLEGKNRLLTGCSDNMKKIFRLLRLQHRQLRLVTLGGSPPRTYTNYRQRLGARHQLAPECGSSY